MNRHRNDRRRERTLLFRLAAAVGWLVVVSCDAERQTNVPVDPCTEHPCSVEAVVAQIGDAYEQRNYAHFSRLLHDDFRFILHADPNQDPYVPPPPTDWGKVDELRIHRRMFEPTNTAPDPELPMELWLTAVNIGISPTAPLTEVGDYYDGPSNPGGLDSMRWKAWGGEYSTQVLFETRGETDYQVNGTQWFVVLQDLTKAPHEAGAFSLYRWQDLGGPSAVGGMSTSAGVEPRSWSRIKLLYNR